MAAEVNNSTVSVQSQLSRMLEDSTTGGVCQPFVPKARVGRKGP